MKKISVFAISLCLAFTVSAQQKSIDQIFKKYEGTEGVTSVYISEKAFEMFASIAPESTIEIKNMVSEIKGIRVLAFENADKQSIIAQMYKDASAAIPINEFVELINIIDDGERVSILAKQMEEGILSDLIILVGGKNEFVLVSIFGKIDLNQISKMTSNMSIKGLDKLNQLENK